MHTVYGTPIRGDDCEIREVGDFLLFYDFWYFFYWKRGGGEMVRKDREAVKKVKILDGRYGREVAKRKPQCTKERGWAIDKQTDTQTKKKNYKKWEEHKANKPSQNRSHNISPTSSMRRIKKTSNSPSTALKMRQSKFLLKFAIKFEKWNEIKYGHGI